MRTRQRTLAHERDSLETALRRCEELRSDLGLQQQLLEAQVLDGMVLARQDLFGWMRRAAADKRKTRDLRFELEQQLARAQTSSERVDGARQACRKSESRVERYQTLLKREAKQRRMGQLEREENDIEERNAWKR